jgi:copper chaperone
METLKFKTNIKCNGCIATATPFLNDVVGEDNWAVDTQTAEKVLTIVAEDLSPDMVVKAVHASGFKAEEID